MIQLISNNYYTLYWISVLIFLIILFFIYKRNKENITHPLVLFFSVFLFFLYWIPQGFDLTDEGFTLSKSWFMLHGMWDKNINLTWGSTFINGIWLSIAGSPALLWARIGYAVFWGVLAVLNFNILKTFFKRKLSFFFVFLLIILMPLGYPQNINYQNLPVIFILLSFLFFIKSLRTDNRSGFFFSGFFLFISVITRFPVILFVLFPALYFLIEIFRYPKNFKRYLRNYLFTLLGFTSSLLLISLILYITDSLEIFYNSIISTFGNTGNVVSSHSTENLMQIYLSDTWMILEKSFLFILFITVFVFISAKFSKKLYKILIVILFGSGLFYYSTVSSTYHNWMYTILSFQIASVLIFFIVNIKDFGKYYLLLFMGVFLFSMYFIGSNMGFRMHIWTGSMIFFGSAFILLLNTSEIQLKSINYDFKNIKFVFLLFLLLLCITTKRENIYREFPRNELAVYFKTPELSGIKSTKERVEVVDSLMDYIKHNIEEDVMYVGTSPMLYYLSNKKYPLKDLWRQPKHQFEDYLLLNDQPENFVFTKINPRNPRWPLADSPKPFNDSVNYSYYKQFVIENHFRKVYENTMFEVYSAKK